MTTVHSSELSINQASGIVRDAWYQGRMIVPVIGAGMSVNAGVPALGEIIRYLAMLEAFIDRNCFLPEGIRQKKQLGALKHVCDQYRRDPSTYIEDFGWPRRFDLEYIVGNEFSPKPIHDVVGIYREKLIFRMFEGEKAAVRSLLKIVNASKDDGVIWESTSLLLDWRKLIHAFTGFKRELSDSLFSSIHSQREPGLAHTYLAELVKLFGARSIFYF